MKNFKFYIRVKGKLTTVFESGVNMQHAFDIILDRMNDIAYVNHVELR